MKKIVFLFTMVCTAMALQAQCGMIPKPIQERVSESSLIVEAKVIAQEGVWGTNRDVIMTLNTLEVYKVFKGNIQNETIQLLTYGGTVGLTHDKVNIGLELIKGQTGIFTLKEALTTVDRAGVFYEAVAAKQGIISYSRVDGTARDYQDAFENYNDVYRVVQSQTRNPIREVKPLDFKHGSIHTSRAPSVISSFVINGSGTTGNSGVGDVLTINGSGFDPDGDGTPAETNGVNSGTSGVFFADANAGGTLTLGLYTDDMLISWSDTQIVIELPTRAGTGQFGVQTFNAADNITENGFSGSAITINFAHLNVPFNLNDVIPAALDQVQSWETRLVDEGSLTGYSFQYNNGLVSTAGAADTYDDIITTWRCATGVYFDRGADTAVSADADDEINIVTFDGSILPGGSSTLAYARSRYLGCLNSTAAFFFVEEMDVVINDAISWYYGDALPVPGGQYDFETVILHELGHTHQLGHIINSSEVMHYAIGSGTSLRSLSENDLAGAAYVMDRSTAPAVCGGTSPLTDYGTSANTSTTGVSIYSGGSWSNGGPTNDKVLVVADNFTTNTTIEGCNCRVENGATLTITENNPLVIGGKLDIDGSIVVENNASIVQEEELAVVNMASTGNFQMVRTTTPMSGRDFSFMSAPVGNESRNGVFNSARKVIGMIPANFTADSNVSSQFPNAENFLSVDNTYLNQFNSDVALTPGEGYIVFPHEFSVADASPITETFTFEASGASETVNSGTITFPLYDDEVKTENINLLGNPYPSGISVLDLITENPGVSEVYFWETGNDPSPTVMGYLNANYSMEDFTVCNGIGCASGGDTSMIDTSGDAVISAGQGFAIKAEQNAAANVTFTNAMRVATNNTFRNNISDKDRIWVKIENEKYDLFSQTLIGFDENATPGLDSGYDTKRNATALNVFSHTKDGNYLAIQGREPFRRDMEIEIGFSTVVEESLQYRISIDHMTGLHISDSPIYLIDKLLGMYVNLRDRNYEFTSGAVTAERFLIVFEQPEILGVEEVSTFEQGVTMFPNPASSQVTLAYSGTQKLHQAVITDVNGKVVMNVDLSEFDQSKAVSINALASGIYFVTIQSDNDQVTKKLVVK